jgi:hypothetical protein
MKRAALLLVVMTAWASAALAEDLSPPPWDLTLPNQTVQMWQMPMLVGMYLEGTLLTGDMTPSMIENPYGVPGLVLPWGEMEIFDELSGQWHSVFVEVTVQRVDYMPPNGRGPEDIIPGTPTIHIGVTEGGVPSGVPVPVSIWIPNNPDPNMVKKIFWQMTSDKSPTPQANPPTTIPAGTSTPTTIPSYQHDGSTWYTYNGLNEIRPNPAGEWLTFGLVDSTNIEEIVIKTVCMPEPATMALLGLGGAVTLLSRRRRA